jgi:hypothetical protein
VTKEDHEKCKMSEAGTGLSLNLEVKRKIMKMEIKH